MRAEARTRSINGKNTKIHNYGIFRPGFRLGGAGGDVGGEGLRHSFAIRSSRKVLQLYAEDRESMDKWVRMLRKCATYDPGNSEAPPIQMFGWLEKSSTRGVTVRVPTLRFLQLVGPCLECFADSTDPKAVKRIDLDGVRIGKSTEQDNTVFVAKKKIVWYFKAPSQPECEQWLEKLGQQAQTALSRKAQETQRAAQEAAKRAAARGGPYAQQLQARATQAAAKQTELLRKQAAEQAKAAAAVASKQPAFQQVSRTYSSVAPAVTKAYATAAPVIKNTAVKYAAVPAGEALRKASQELQKTKEYKTFAAKPEAAIGVGTFLFATVIALAAPKPAKIVAPPPPPEPVVVVAPSITAIKALDVTKVKLPEVDVSKVKLPDVDVAKGLESIKKIDVSKVKVPDVSTIDVSKASAQLGDAAKKTTAEASKTISKAAQDAGPAIGAFTADVAVPALKYGADETTKAASAAASQVAVEASKVDWAGLAEGALEQTVVFLVYVPVFAYTFAASLPAEEQFVLGLVVLLVVGSFAKQDD